VDRERDGDGAVDAIVDEPLVDAVDGSGVGVDTNAYGYEHEGDVSRLGVSTHRSVGVVKGEVSVCVRVRPMNSMERQTKQSEAWSTRDNIIFQTYLPNEIAGNTVTKDGTSMRNGLVLKQQPKPMSYMFDHIFTEQTDNQHIFRLIGRPILDNSMIGYHGCVFAYVHTTHTHTHTHTRARATQREQ